MTIDVLHDDLITTDVECVVRPVSSNLKPVTGLGRAVGAAAGAELEERIGRVGELAVSPRPVSCRSSWELWVPLLLRSPASSCPSERVWPRCSKLER